MNTPETLKRHYGAGPRHAFCYTYANPVEVGSRQPLQLEFWVPKGRKGGSWVVTSGDASRPELYRTWRRVIPSHSHADKLAHSIGAVKPGGYNRSAEAVKESYLAWAQRAGLNAVHVFKGDGYAIAAARTAFGFTAIEVDPDDFHGPAPEPEIESEAA